MKPVLVAVVGGSASGKTTLARDLVDALHPRSVLVSQDSFYRSADHLPPSRRERINFDHPRRIDWPLLVGALDHLLAGRTASIPRYNFERHAREKDTDRLPPAPVLVAEGLWLLSRRDIRARCNFGIFVTCPSSERLGRRLRRDTAERGRTRAQGLRQWRQQTEPGFRRFVAPQLDFAHAVVRSPVHPDQVANLARQIRTLAEHQP